MDVDQRTFRQWWVYPVDSSLFRFGSENVLYFPVKNIKIFRRIFSSMLIPPVVGPDYFPVSQRIFLVKKDF